MTFQIATEVEADGRWLAEVEVLPGVVSYGTTRVDAVTKVQALALRVLALVPFVGADLLLHRLRARSAAGA